MNNVDLIERCVNTGQIAHTIFAMLISRVFLVFIFLIPLPACKADGEYQKLPISKKIDISQPDAKAEMLLHISREDDYAFSLLFKYKNKDEIDRVFALMEGEDAFGHRTSGEKTPISIEVYTIKNGQNVLVSLSGGESFPANASSLGYLKLIYNDYLMPGDYRVVVESKAGNPKFKDIEVEVYIGKAHKPK